MAKFLRFNSLSLFFLAIFVVTIVAQSLAGLHDYNEEQAAHDEDEVSWTRYVRTSHFGVAVLENWQSEWLQFFLFILATVWLLQQGSPESKALNQAGLESDEEQKIGRYADRRSPGWAKVGGWRTRIYENSLFLAFAVIFLLSWFAQSVTGWTHYNNEQEAHDEATVAWSTYISRPDFWERTLQNWQSEFLAVGTMAVFSIYLRQRGSPESKPVGSAHDETGSTG
ncbi:MAG TPA: DUF6766 family protein [Gaiellaceae bacterium]|nr:DUF6766 family protein [Gaiellaceae bacterium]